MTAIWCAWKKSRQSVRVVEQCMAQMPGGPVQLDDARMTMQPKAEVYGTIEGLMNHFKLIIEGIKPPAGEAYVPVEGANGELGFYLVSDGTGRPYRCRVRPPCLRPHAGPAEDAQGRHGRRRGGDFRHHQHDRRRERPVKGQ